MTLDNEPRALIPPGFTMLAILVLGFLFGRPFVVPGGEWGFWDVVRGTFFVSMAGYLVLLGSKILLPKPRITDEERKMYTRPWGAVLLFVVILGPLWEEFVFRYVLVGALYESTPILAVLLSGIVFGLVHTHYKLAKVVKGIGYAWLYVMSGTIWVPFIAHAVWNLGCMLMVRKRFEQRLYEDGGW